MIGLIFVAHMLHASGRIGPGCRAIADIETFSQLISKPFVTATMKGNVYCEKLPPTPTPTPRLVFQSREPTFPHFVLNTSPSLIDIDLGSCRDRVIADPCDSPDVSCFSPDGPTPKSTMETVERWCSEAGGGEALLVTYTRKKKP